jgi:hypothetical protein
MIWFVYGCAALNLRAQVERVTGNSQFVAVCATVPHPLAAIGVSLGRARGYSTLLTLLPAC